MTPQEVIDECLWHYPQNVDRGSLMENLFNAVLREVLERIEIEEFVQDDTVTLTDQGSYFSGSLTQRPLRFLEVLVGKDRLVPISVGEFFHLPNWVQSGTFYSFEPRAQLLYINKGTSALTDVRARYLFFNPISTFTDYSWLDRLYRVFSVGLKAKVALMVKDMERAQLFEAEYLQLLGYAQQGGQG